MCRANLNKPTKVELNSSAGAAPASSSFPSPFSLSLFSFFPFSLPSMLLLLFFQAAGHTWCSFKCFASQSTFVVCCHAHPFSAPPLLLPFASFQQAAQIRVARRHLVVRGSGKCRWMHQAREEAETLNAFFLLFSFFFLYFLVLFYASCAIFHYSLLLLSAGVDF